MGRDRYEGLDMGGGVYNSRKLPKWRFNSLDVMMYMQTLDEESMLTETGGE